jgi:hypothetical protein
MGLHRNIHARTLFMLESVDIAMPSTSPDCDENAFQRPAAGYAVLVTWPEMRNGKHLQDVWYAHLGGQLEAVRAVQEACGALNDAKVELLNHLSEAALQDHGVSAGAVKKAQGKDFL